MKTIALAFSLLAAAAAGCSTLPRATTGAVGRSRTERHGTTPVYVGAPKTLVRGPALIRHLELDGDGPLALYLADDHGVADRACPSARAERASTIAVLAAGSRLTNLTVPAGKRVCARTDGAPSQVAWHAQAGELPERAVDVAMLSR